MHVLRHTVAAVEPGGLVLDLQVIRPDPLVEADGRVVCEVDGSPLFRMADAATAAVDDAIATGLLVEEAVDDHDVRKHYLDGPALVADFETSRRNLPAGAIPELETLTEPVVVRERCRLRRLRVR